MKLLMSVLFLSIITILTACQKRPVPEIIQEERASFPFPQVSQPIAAVEAPSDKDEEQGAEGEPEVAEIPPDTRYWEEVFAADLSDVEFVSLRQKVYGNKISQWRMLVETIGSLDMEIGEPSLWQDCIKEMERILAGYDGIAKGLPEESHVQSAVWQNDILFLASDCEAVFAEQMVSVSEQLDHYTGLSVAQAEKVVSHYAEQENYERVIVLYQRLITATDRKPDLLTQEIYGHALQRTGKLAEASEVFLAVADFCENSKSWRLRLHAADMLTAIGSFDKALEQYRIVAESFDSWRTVDQAVQARLELLDLDNVQGGNEGLHLYAQALRSWMTGSGKELPDVLFRNVRILENKYSGSIYAEEGIKLRIQVEDSVRGYVRRALEEIRSLVLEKKFHKAQRIVEELAQLKTPGETAQLIKIAEDEIKQAEADEKILQQQLKEESIAAQWQQANLFFDQKEYDKAIDLFRGLVNSEYQNRALRKIDKATQIAAIDMRKRAALLFSKSRKISGMEKKAALLLESRSILQEIIRRYPEAKIIDKVVVNLDVIENQIRNLDPSLLDDF
ncbi:MAG: hypothetical protein GQ541_05615 [Desulfovibrionaceae bacterium]|nr:hypothetical protein [Desulfovibrionaceae bacterium]